VLYIHRWLEMSDTDNEIDKIRKKFPKPETKTRELVGHKKKAHSVAWSLTGDKLASGSLDHTVRIWYIERKHGKDTQELKGHTDGVNQLCFNPMSNDELASASSDKTVKLWDTRQAKCVHSISTGGQNINIAWSPDGTTVAVGTREDSILLIDPRKLKIIKVLKSTDRREMNEFAWTRDNALFLITTGVGTILVHSTNGSMEPKVIPGHSAANYCIEIDPVGRYFAVGSADSLVSLWDVRDLICVRTYDNIDSSVRSLSFSHDGVLLASGSEDGVIDILHVDSGEKILDIKCEGPMNSIAWHPKQYLLAYVTDEREKQPPKISGVVRIYG
jgi:THO complex subunit 3